MVYFVKANFKSTATAEVPGHLVFPGVLEGQENKDLLKSSVLCGPGLVKVPVHVWLAAESGPDEITPVYRGRLSYSRTLVQCLHYRKDRM